MAKISYELQLVCMCLLVGNGFADTGYGSMEAPNKAIVRVDLADTRCYRLGGDGWHDLVDPDRTGKLLGFSDQPNRGWVGDGTVQNPYALHFTGRPGNVVAFEDDFPVGGNDITVELWYRGERGAIVGQYRRGAASRRVSLVAGGSHNGFYTCIYGHTTASATEHYPSADQWVQLVFTRNGRDGNQRFFVNAEPRHLWRNDASARFAGAGPWFLGAMAPDEPEREWFKGDMAVLRIYRRELTAEEIKQNFRRDAGRFGLETEPSERAAMVTDGLVLHLDAADPRSNRGINQILNNQATGDAVGWLGDRQDPDPRDPLVCLTPWPALRFEPGKGSIVRLKPMSGLSSVDGLGVELFLEKGTLGGRRAVLGNDDTWLIDFTSDFSGSIHARFGIRNRNDEWCVLRSSTPLATRSLRSGWMQLAAVYEPGKRMELWINGRRDAELMKGVPDVSINDKGDILLGGGSDANPDSCFDGSLALLAIYDHSLSGDSIRASFETHRGRFADDLAVSPWQTVKPIMPAPIVSDPDTVDIREKSNAVFVTWFGRDGKCRRLVIDTQRRAGLIRGLWIDRDGDRTFEPGTEIILPVGQLDWWLRGDGFEHHLDYRDAKWRVMDQRTRATLTAAGVRLGPITGDLRMRFCAESNVFACELAVKGANGSIAAEQLGTGLRWFRAGKGEKINTFARCELDTSVAGCDRPRYVSRQFNKHNRPNIDGRFFRTYYKAATLSGSAGSVTIDPPPHLGWYFCDPYLTDRPGPYADAGVIHYDYNHHRLTQKLEFHPDDKRLFTTIWHVEPMLAEKAVHAAYAYQNHHCYPKLPGYKVVIADTDMADPVGTLYARNAGVNVFCATVNDRDFFTGSEWADVAKKHFDVADPTSGRTDPRWQAHVKTMSQYETEDFAVCVGTETTSGQQYKGNDKGSIVSHMGYIGPRHDSYFAGAFLGNAEPTARKVASIGGVTWLAHPRFSADFLRRHWEPELLGLAVNALAMSSYPGQKRLFRHDMLSGWLSQVDGLWRSGYRPLIIGEFDSQGFPGYTTASRHGSRIYPEAVVNYVRTDTMKLSDLIDAMRRGAYFVTTGEILMPEYSFEPDLAGGPTASLKLKLCWTYPLREIRIVGSHGTTYHPVPPGEFRSETITVPIDTSGTKWLRADVRDVAGNYCLGQPILLATCARKKGASQ